MINSHDAFQVWDVASRPHASATAAHARVVNATRQTHAGDRLLECVATFWRHLVTRQRAQLASRFTTGG
jgi:hypothetical protein